MDGEAGYSERNAKLIATILTGFFLQFDAIQKFPQNLTKTFELKLNAATVEKSFVDKCWVAVVGMFARVLNNNTTAVSTDSGSESGEVVIGPVVR